SEEKTTLPQIVYTAHSVAFYPQLGDLIDTERSAIALGFESGGDKDEIIWIAAEIDSKLEAAADLAEFWCDRLEMVAASCDFSAYKIWLVAPEGFSDDALRLIADRNAIGSSRRQVDLLICQFDGKTIPSSDTNSDEYEIVIPMGEDTEMIAAHTIEEIAKRHDFPAKTINQIKTALVEACINAAEHSHSPDRKIYQKFAVTDKKITITISNRGLRIADRAAKTVTSETGRRGWGLKLIQGLMDEVKVEQTDDGTRITMVKFVSR
ncbi:MAG: ATP-binding protein, partial [Pyrinomonadaceae bacterium]